MSTDDSTDTDRAEPAEYISGAHLAHLLGKVTTAGLRELLGRDLAEIVVGWHRTTVGRCDPDPMAEEVLAVPLTGNVEDLAGTRVAEFLADHGVTVPTRPECREFALADRAAGGDGVDPLEELARARYCLDPDLDAVRGPQEERIGGVPKSVYEGFALAGQKHHQEKIKAGLVIPPPKAPMYVARWLIRHRFTARVPLPGQRRRAWMRTLICIDQTWYHYARPAAGEPYRWVARTDPSWLPGVLREILGDLWYVHIKELKDGNQYRMKSWNPNVDSIREVEAALSGPLSDAHGTAAHELPDAYGKRHNVYDGAAVLCRNGVLNLTTGAVVPNTPLWFGTTVVPAAYDPTADWSGSEWEERVLLTQWPDDPGAVACVQQWFGYVLTGRTDLQKWMLMIGPPGSSKGIITRVLAALMGASTATSLRELNGRFGLQELYESGAQLATMGDIRFNAADSSTAVGNMLTVTGEDLVKVERKGRVGVSAKLPIRFHGCANEMPRWADNSAALQRRTLIVETTKEFRSEGGDPHLEDRILANELPLVLRWAVEGLALLNESGGRFAESKHAAELREEMDEGASVIRSFLRECVVIGTDDDSVTLPEFYREFRHWSEETGSGKGTSQNGLMRAVRGMHHEVVKVGQRKGETVKRIKGVKSVKAPDPLSLR